MGGNDYMAETARIAHFFLLSVGHRSVRPRADPELIARPVSRGLGSVPSRDEPSPGRRREPQAAVRGSAHTSNKRRGDRHVGRSFTSGLRAAETLPAQSLRRAGSACEGRAGLEQRLEVAKDQLQPPPAPLVLHPAGDERRQLRRTFELVITVSLETPPSPSSISHVRRVGPPIIP